MKAVMDAIHEFCKDLVTRECVHGAVAGYTLRERHELLEQYAREFGPHIPRQYRTKSAGALAHRFAEVISHHMQVVEPALRAEVERA